MIAAFFGALAVAVLLTWALTGRRPEIRPVALLMTAGLASEAGHMVIETLVLAPARASLGASVPWTGWPRVAGHAADAMSLVWPAALVGAGLVVFVGRSAWPAFVGWGCAVGALAVAHPIAWNGSLAVWMTGAETIATATSVVLVGLWCRRPGPLKTFASCTLAGIVVFEVVGMIMASRVGAAASHILLWSALAILMGYHLFRQKALEVQHEVLRAHGAARDAAECSANTARALASAVRIAEDQRQQEREANARAEADAAIAIADERRANWDLLDESEFAREIRRREAREHEHDARDPDPSGPRRR